MGDTYKIKNNGDIFRMINKKAGPVISLLVCGILAGSVMGPVYADEEPSSTDLMSFTQTVNVTNPNKAEKTQDLGTFSYSLTPVTDLDLLAVRSSDTVQISAGVESGLALESDSLDFSDITVPAKTSDFSVSKDNTFEFNIDAFTIPGIYRYELDNLSTDEARIIDLYIIYDESVLTLENYNMYVLEDLEQGVLTKSFGFTNDFEMSSDYDIVFRFEDTDDNLLAEDITFVESVGGTPMFRENKPLKAAMKAASIPGSNTLSVLAVYNSIQAIGISDALSLYQETLDRILGKDYTLESDEVAEHDPETPWNKGNIDEESVYHVTFKAKSSSIIPQTGEPATAFIYLTMACLSVIGLVFCCVIIKNKRTKNTMEEKDS